MTNPQSRYSRRAVMGAGAAAAASTLLAATTPRDVALKITEARHGTTRNMPARPVAVPDAALLSRALSALDRHRGQIRHLDRIAIADFSAPSSQPRLHILSLGDGRRKRYLVAHGSGSDPEHTGFLHSFSNTIDSNASSEGAFVTADYYEGKHGRSQRLLGLDETNCNALTRSIVVHGAWYANADMVTAHGKLGRSQGCFAVGDSLLSEVFEHLGEGRLIYAAKA